jgi:PIN domain nuclease of toxin-antitoxin system
VGTVTFLLDTHALLWWLFDDPRLPGTARAIIAEPENRIYASSASAWEISTKHRLGKLSAAATLVQDIEGWFRRARFAELPILTRHAQRAGAFHLPHRDPFDRMLAAQSELEEAPLVTQDPAFAAFGIRTVW